MDDHYFLHEDFHFDLKTTDSTVNTEAYVCLGKKNKKCRTFGKSGTLYCLAQGRLAVDCGRRGSNSELFQTDVVFAHANCPHLNAFHSRQHLS